MSDNMSTGQIVGGVVGAIVGAYAGNVYYGFVIGSAIGGLVDPVELDPVEGPRIRDGARIPPTVGTPIPLKWGRPWTRGTCIWAGDYVEVATTEEMGGKGGPEQDAKTYTYRRSYAVMFGAGEKGALIKLKRNGKIVYDKTAPTEEEDPRNPGAIAEIARRYLERLAASESFEEGMEVYLGTEDQMPSPTIEAAEGVGNVPAHRGYHYVVFINEDVTDTNTLPAVYEAVFADDAETTETTYTEYANEVLYPWVEDAGLKRDPRNRLNDHEYRAEGFGTWRSTIEEAFTDWESVNSRQFESAKAKETLYGWALGNHGSSDAMAPHWEWDPEERRVLTMYFNTTHPRSTTGVVAPSAPGALCSLADSLFAGARLWWDGGTTAEQEGTGPMADAHGWWQKVDSSAEIPFQRVTAQFNCAGSTILYTSGDLNFFVRRKTRAPDAPCTDYPALPENPDYCVLDTGLLERQVGWTPVSGSFKALSKYADGGTSLTALVTSYPRDPVIVSGSADDTQAFWDAAYAAAVAAGEQPPGKTYQANGLGDTLTKYPVAVSQAYQRQYTESTVDWNYPTLAQVLTDLCLATGLTADDIDVSTMTQEVPAFSIERFVTARAAIEQLRVAYQFDIVEGATLRFVPRGGASVRTFAEDDLGAHYAGQEPPPRVAIERVQDPELPRQIRLGYLSADKDFAPGMQSWDRSRNVTGSENTLDLQLSVGMTDDQARQLVQSLVVQGFVGRERYKVHVGPQDLALEAADAVVLPIDGDSTRARIESITGGLPGVIELQLVREETSALSSSVPGIPAQETPVVTVPLRGPTLVWLLDMAAVRDQDNDAGVYAACWGALPEGWHGASLYRSDDAGETYYQVGKVSVHATVGYTSKLEDGTCLVFDRTNTLTVHLSRGELSSLSELAVLNGGNAAALEVRDDDLVTTLGWEIIQFQDAELVGEDTYTLSTLLRGRKGTEWATGLHRDGDRFVLLNNALTRLTANGLSIGAEVKVKAVTNGTSLENAPEVDITLAGRGLECFSPAHVRVTKNLDTGNYEVTWIRRTRLSGGWKDYSDAPLNEETEAYEYELQDEFQELRASGTVTEPRLELVPLSLIRTLERPVSKLIDIGDDYLYGVSVDPAGGVSIVAWTRDTYEYVNRVSVGGATAYAACAFFHHSGAFYTATLATSGTDGGLVRTPTAAVVAGDASQNTSYISGIGDAQGATMRAGLIWVLDTNHNKIRGLNATTLAISATYDLATIGVTGLGTFTAHGLATDGTSLYTTVEDSSSAKVLKITAGVLTWQVSLGAHLAREVVVTGSKVFVNSRHVLGVAVLSTTDGSVAGYIANPVPVTNWPDLKLHVNSDGWVAVPTSVSTESVTTKFIDPADLSVEYVLTTPGQFFAGDDSDGETLALSTASGAEAHAVLDGDFTLTLWQRSGAAGRGYPTELSLEISL